LGRCTGRCAGLSSANTAFGSQMHCLDHESFASTPEREVILSASVRTCA
jgi:hypothetical protein